MIAPELVVFGIATCVGLAVVVVVREIFIGPADNQGRAMSRLPRAWYAQFLLLTNLFVVIPIVWILTHEFSRTPTFVAMALQLAFGVNLMTVKCPHCGHSYFKGRRFWNSFASRCCRCDRP